jgi:hypothetical protein
VIAALQASFRDNNLPIKVDVVDWHRIAPEFCGAIAGDLVPFACDGERRA